MTNLQPVPEQRLRKIANFVKLLKKTELLQKFKLTTKRGSEPTEMRKSRFLSPGPSHSWTEHDVYGIEYFHYPTWARCLAVLPPSSCTTCSLAEHGRLDKSPWFLSNNWKHQCYQHSSRTKSKTQQLLRGTLTLSQLKPGHHFMEEEGLLLGFLAFLHIKEQADSTSVLPIKLTPTSFTSHILINYIYSLLTFNTTSHRRFLGNGSYRSSATLTKFHSDIKARYHQHA